MTQDVLKYLQPNAAIPIDMETTSLLVNALKKALAERAMSEVQRLGQEIEQELVACERCKQLEEQAYNLVGELRVANIKLSMRPQRTWVGLTDKDWNRSKHNYDFQKGVDWAEPILKQKNGYAEE